MKTLKTVKQEGPEYKKLIQAVINQLGGMDYIGQIRSAEDGYPGFTYYADTHKFAMKNRAQIVQLLQDTADQLGEEVVSMVKNFGVFRNNPADNDDLQDLYRFLGGGRPKQGIITNIMAWFALEEVNRMFEDDF